MKRNSTLHRFLTTYSDLPDDQYEIDLCSFAIFFCQAFFVCLVLIVGASALLSWVPVLFFQFLEWRFESNFSWFIFFFEVIILVVFVFDYWETWEFPRLKGFCSKLPKIKIN